MNHNLSVPSHAVRAAVNQPVNVPQPAPLPEINSELERLRRATSDLDVLTSDLNTRLRPVRQDPNTGEGSSATPESIPATLLGQALRDASRVVEMANSRIQYELNHLAIS